MIGSLISLGGYLLVLFVLNIWMVVKIWRSSPLLAVVSFFFFPAAIIALIKSWNEPESDIKIPFALSLVVLALIYWSSNRVVDKAIEESAHLFTAQEIAEIRREDPEMAARIEAAQAQGRPVDAVDAQAGDAAERLVADRLGGGAPSASTPPTAEEAKAARALEQEAGAEKRARLRMATGGLEPKRGTIRFERAGAVLTLPTHFRFVPRNQLGQIAELREVPLGRDVLGWITHERVNLGADKIWYVEARYVRIDPATVASNDAATIDFSVQSAATPVREGEVRYTFRAPDDLPAELGTRATRLMAANTVAARR